MDFNNLELIGLAFLSGVNIAEEVERLEDEEQDKLEYEKCRGIPESEIYGEHKIEEKETHFEVGDKVKVIDIGTSMMGFGIGDICTITKVYDTKTPEYEILRDKDNSTYGYAEKEKIIKVNESEDK